ncbi:MAG: tetratricopeptide repeat protein, partial [Myxococcota bacterium]
LLVASANPSTSSRDRELSLHEWSAAMRRLKIAPDIRGLVGAKGFYGSASSKSYTLMGSFSLYLIERYGMDTYLKAYPRADFEGAYGRSVDQLVGEWEVFIDGLELQAEVLPLAEFYFDRKSIFTKVCARTIAALRDEGRDLLARQRTEAALSCYRQIVTFNPKSASYRLQLVAALRKAKRLDEALDEAHTLLEAESIPSVRRAEALRERGDLGWLRGEWEAAEADYRDALSRPLPWATRRGLAARLEALAAPDREGGTRALAQSYLLSQDRSRALYDVTRWAHLAPGSGLANYLVGRQLWSRYACSEAIGWLERALAAEQRPLPDTTLTVEAQRLLGICRLTQRDWEGAREAFKAIVAAELPEGIRAQAREWLERVAWEQAVWEQAASGQERTP